MTDFTNDEKTNLLFKKLMNKPSALIDQPFYQEPNFSSRSNINTEQIWTYSSLIPDIAPNALRNQKVDGTMTGTLSDADYESAKGSTTGITSGYLTRYIELELEMISGSNGVSYRHEKLKRVIPFNKDEGGSYLYQIYYDGGGYNTSTSTSVKRLNFGVGEWVLDPDSGVLTFYQYSNVSGSPYNIGQSKPPKISFFVYNGPVGFSQNLYSQQTISTNPPANQGIVYLNTSNQLVFRDDTGTETNLLNSGSGTSSNSSVIVKSDTNILIIDSDSSSGVVKFTIDGTERMRLDQNGVGIGTISPSTELDVNGTILAKKYRQKYIVTAAGGKYFINGIQNPILTLQRGKEYLFDVSDSSTSNHPFYITHSSSGGGDAASNKYENQNNIQVVTGNGNKSDTTSTTILFKVPDNAPGSLYYQCGLHSNMGNKINIDGTVLSDSLNKARITVESVSNENTIRFTTDNTERMTISSTGNIGFNKTSPSQLVDVAGNALISGKLGVGTTDLDNKLNISGDAYFSGKMGIGTTTPTNQLDVRGGTSYFDTKVGIGTTTPKTALHLGGSSNNAGIIHISTEYNIVNPNIGSIPADGGLIYVNDRSRLTFRSTAGTFDLTHNSEQDGLGEVNIMSNASDGTTGTGEVFIDKRNSTFFVRKVKGQEGINVSNVSNDIVIKTQIGLPSSGNYTSVGNIGLNDTMNVANAFGTLDSWLIRNLVDTPPAPTTHSSSNTATQIKIRWNNPAQIELGFQDIKVPKINNIFVDYQNNNANVWNNTINTTSSETNNVIFYVASGSDSLTSSTNTYNKYGITGQQAYDFRIYGVNDNDNDPKKYLYFYNLSTTVIGPPNKPTDLIINSGATLHNRLGFTWTAPTDTNNATAELDTDPPIENYKLELTPVSSTRYGGVYNTTTVNNTFTNTSGTVNGLFPGTLYTAKVYAKNNQNSNYGNASIVIESRTQTHPFPSDSLGSININSVNTYKYANNISSYFLLNGSTVYNGNSVPLLNSNLLNTASPGNIVSNVKSGFRVNHIVSDQNTSVANITATVTIAGNDTTTSSVINGFGKANATDSTNGVVTLDVSNEGDFYTNENSGFWKKISAQLKTNDPKTNFPPSNDEYSFKLSISRTSGSTNHTTVKRFRVDDIAIVPTVSNALIKSVTVSNPGTDHDFVSGVLTAKNGTKIRPQFNVTELAHYYLRNDLKHATVTIKNNNGNGSSSFGDFTIGKNNISGSNFYFVGVDTNTSTTKAGVAASGQELIAGSTQQKIQFNTFDITMEDASNTLDENGIGISVFGFNIIGTSSEATGIHANGGNAKIRLDTVSTTALGNLSHTQVRSGTGDYPLKGTSAAEFGGAYDHKEHVGVGNYSKEMVIYNGSFSASGTGYNNYSTQYLVFDGVAGGYTYPDYGSIGSGYRYVTFSTINISGSFGVRINISGTGFSNQIESDMTLQVKVDGASGTGWINANAALAGTGVISAQEFSGTTATVSGSNVTLSTPTPNMTNYATTGALIGRKILVNNVLGNITAYNGSTKVATVTWNGTAPASGSYKLWQDNVSGLGVSGDNNSTGTLKYVNLPNSTGTVYVRVGITGTSKKLSNLSVTNGLS